MIARLVLSLLILLGLGGPALAAPDMVSMIADLERQWAKASYQLPVAEQQPALKAVLQQAEAISRQFPHEALPLAWRGIILCSYAEARGGLQALGNVTEARDLFLQAKKLDPQVMNGTVDGYLGTLYYKVPGWPIGFGDMQRAREYFRRALAENPGSLDTHFLYGEFLSNTADKDVARRYLTAGLAIPIRADHAEYDAGRRQDIAGILAGLK